MQSAVARLAMRRSQGTRLFPSALLALLPLSPRLVSSVQAIMASTAGYIVSTSCKHIIDDQ